MSTIPRNPNLTLRIMWSVWERSDFKYDEMEIILFQGNFYIFTKMFVWETHRGETYWRSPGWVDDLCTLVRETRRNIFNWDIIFSNQPRLPPSTETRNILSRERVLRKCGGFSLAGIIGIIVFWEYIDPCQENAAGTAQFMCAVALQCTTKTFLPRILSLYFLIFPICETSRGWQWSPAFILTPSQHSSRAPLYYEPEQCIASGIVMIF